MTHRTPLLLGVHAHQPVGNFPHVIDDAVLRCYHPFLEAMHRFPEFPFAIHISGWLLAYMVREHPKTILLLQNMVTRHQAELVGAGDTEPVLAAIPHADRITQIQAMSDRLDKHFGQRPVGAWLTERVWDPSVVPALQEAGVKYVMVDDYHFLCAGAASNQLGSFHRTEENGQSIDVFPISEALRYRLPFSEAATAVSYIEDLSLHNPGSAGIYFDDIEKFGVWPETYSWVYEKGWLEQFLRGVLASPHIQPLRFKDYLHQHRPQGIIYLPTVSYSEMNEWTLAPDAARTYAAFLEQEKAAGRIEERKSLIRGGIWKNFMTRYPESNWMQKRMLQLSKRFHALPKRQQSKAMREDLHESQANDAYWHGLFGGIYLPHLRRAVYNAIVRLEAQLDQIQPRPALQSHDVDLDGYDELFYHNNSQQLIIRPTPYAAVAEWDCYALKHNLGDTLARRDEAYYDKIRHGHSAPEAPSEGIASAHDRISFKTEITTEDLAADLSPCQSFQEWLDADPIHYQDSHIRHEIPHFSGGVGDAWAVSKEYQLTESRLRVQYRLESAHADNDTHAFHSRLFLAMPSCDGPAGQFFADAVSQGGFGMPIHGEDTTQITLEDAVLGGKIILSCNPPMRWESMPHLTVSQSEAGFEKIMQALKLDLFWSVQAGKAQNIEIQVEVLAHD
ncbi:MAG: alpha-amylase/4-alpha-glucanotransferase domain-containing protein [Acidithiobacillus sp.]